MKLKAASMASIVGFFFVKSYTIVNLFASSIEDVSFFHTRLASSELKNPFKRVNAFEKPRG